MDMYVRSIANLPIFLSVNLGIGLPRTVGTGTVLVYTGTGTRTAAIPNIKYSNSSAPSRARIARTS